MFKQLREDIACIYERDPAARSRWEILTCYPGLHAILVHRLAHRLWNTGFLWSARFISHISRIFTGIEIHPGAKIGNRVFFDHGTGIVIGETAEVGDDCTIYQGVTLGGTSLYKGTKRHPTLEEGVVVGAGAQILGGFTIGAHAKIGSNAVVVKPVPANATAIGNSARIITKEDKKPAEEDPTTEEHTSCQSEWTGKPLKEILKNSARLQQSTSYKSSDAVDTDPDAFSAYAVDSSNNDPLVQVIHELINHSAQQEQRINKLCHVLEELGQRVENGQQPLDVDRLNKMME